LLLLIAPCNSSKKITKTAEQDNSKVVIIFQTTACFGRCPIYTLTINGESKIATFIGERDTEKLGTYTKSISNKELSDFKKAFEDSNFNSLNDEYPGTITDFPYKYITYTNNGKTKKIKERSGAPKELTDLEKLLSEYANSEGWKKTEGSSNSKD
ncbi:MAG: DUF6438 domain-containing protein, partial [Bacteroidetes bacterium]|nr:DUF6438 domain-containing protein [Bacteroidota bacterium]